jgi:hypothetical protein
MHARAEDLLKLRELPELAPPPGAWERVLEGVGARAAARRLRRRYAVAAAVIVAAAAVPLSYVAANLDPPRPTLSRVVHAPARVPWNETSYAPLVAESARLERVLAEMPERPVVAGSTAGTIVGLEDRIAYVDAQLSYAAARDLAPTYRQALWGERVELLNALVYVRFAQTQGF